MIPHVINISMSRHKSKIPDKLLWALPLLNHIMSYDTAISRWSSVCISSSVMPCFSAARLLGPFFPPQPGLYTASLPHILIFPTSHSRLVRVCSLTGEMFREDRKAMTCVAPMPACSIPKISYKINEYDVYALINEITLYISMHANETR